MNGDFSKISPIFFKKIMLIAATVLLLAIFFICFEIYFPLNTQSQETVSYAVEKGWSSEQIAANLQKLGMIRSASFFNFYAVVSLKHSALQAGEYSLSPKMSIYEIVNKMAAGEVIKETIKIMEGWSIKDIGKYMESQGICSQSNFTALTKQDYSGSFDFLQDKPKSADIEGYIFPDTYEISKNETCQDVIMDALANFGKKLTPEMRTEIKNQKKSIFDIVTMASLVEKEVKTLADKKIVAGILWKRIQAGMPLQLDATIVYITGNPVIYGKDKKINSPYNTYKYYGLPKGPISNPGTDSIMAAIYPTKTNYWYYVTDGKTIFSETLDQQNAAIAKYLK